MPSVLRSSFGPESLGSALDIPSGRIDAIPSGVTGKPLRYATPAPLSELLRRCEGVNPQEPADYDSALVAWLLPVASYRGSAAATDSTQAHLIGEVALKLASYQTRDEILRLGGKIHPTSQRLREENVFTGAIGASEARHIYAPHEVLSDLVQDLAETLKRPPRDVDPVVLAAVVALYCSCMHPFKDGNGRWTRIIAMQAAVSAGNPGAGVLVCSFLALFYAELAGDIWPSSFSTGMRKYVFLAIKFSAALARGINASPYKHAVKEILETLKEYSPSRREYERVVVSAFARNTLDMAQIKSSYGLSGRRSEGLSRRIQHVCDQRNVSIWQDGPALASVLWKIALDAKQQNMEDAA